MLDTQELQDQLLALDHVEEASRRQAMQSLKQHDRQAWASVPVNIIHTIVKSLQNRLQGVLGYPSIRQDVATVLGNIGPLAKSAVPELIELLQNGVPDGIRAVTVIALGKIGKEATGAIDPLITLLSKNRPTLAVPIIKALSDIGCADKRVR